MRFSYKSAGVNIDAANESKQYIKELVKKTFNSHVLSNIGGFGGLYELKGYNSPVLVSSVDGVGTKLKVAIMADKHGTIGEDLVNHCINDILVQGAKPLFFLDYIAMGKMRTKTVKEIIQGLARGCSNSNCALIGGETAEMPDMYKIGEYDLAGCIIGIVEKKNIINGKSIKAADAVIGIASSGLHTNGYSLARKLLFDYAKYPVNEYVDELKTTAGNELLKVHKCYLNLVFSLKKNFTIKGLAHITGGGFLENIPRILPDNTQVIIKKGSWEILPIFTLLQGLGKLYEKEMYRTFNMGIGMVMIVPKQQAKKIINVISSFNEKAWIIGEVVKRHSNEKEQVRLI